MGSITSYFGGCWRGVVALATGLALASLARGALTIQFDYSRDTTGFFTAHQERKDLLALAAGAFTSQLGDSFSAITPGSGNTWTAQPFDPNNPGSLLDIVDLAISANTIVVYAGATNLGGATLGIGGPGGYQVGSTNAPAQAQDWFNLVASRGQAGALAATPTDFGPWGGAITFSTTADWYFDSDPTTTGDLPTGKSDFYSVAVHELGHLLGLGTAGSWDAQVSGNVFTGAASTAAKGGTVNVSPDLGHWAEGTMSTVVGTAVVQEAEMDPTLTTGTRKFFTVLDYAGLQDVGWQVSVIPEPAGVAWVAALGALALAAQRPVRQAQDGKRARCG